MSTSSLRVSHVLALVSLLALSTAVDAERGRPGGGSAGHRSTQARGAGGGHQRGGGKQQSAGGHSRGGAQHAQRGTREAGNRTQGNRGGVNTANANRANANRANVNNANVNRANVNRANVNNVNVNRRNVNVNNVNVNRNVNVHGVGYWGRPPIAAPRYYWPHGYHYVRRPVGWIVPAAFLTSAYIYTSWAALGLMAPPPSQQWVRYGPDLLLVDLRSGQVIDVRYGVFQQ
jgi:Ni/Co efflux regulator RcnB